MDGEPCRYSWVDDAGDQHDCMTWGKNHRSLHHCCCGAWADE